jgi:hypothetical protein
MPPSPPPSPSLTPPLPPSHHPHYKVLEKLQRRIRSVEVKTINEPRAGKKCLVVRGRGARGRVGSRRREAGSRAPAHPAGALRAEPRPPPSNPVPHTLPARLPPAGH